MLEELLISGIYKGSILKTGSTFINLIILYRFIELISKLSPPSGRFNFLNTFTITPTLYISSVEILPSSFGVSDINKLSPKNPFDSSIALFTEFA